MAVELVMSVEVMSVEEMAFEVVMSFKVTAVSGDDSRSDGIYQSSVSRCDANRRDGSRS
jgi:hypothetical protein